MKSELKALGIKAIEKADVVARERKMGKEKLAAMPYRQTPLGELQALFNELSELATDAQLWDLSDEDDVVETW